jgi:hypothetical protein
MCFAFYQETHTIDLFLSYQEILRFIPFFNKVTTHSLEARRGEAGANKQRTKNE